MEDPDLFDFDDPELDELEAERRPVPVRRPMPQVHPASGIWSAGERATWIAGLVLMLSSFMSWYSGTSSEGLPTVGVIGWHTGTIGKLVFFIGLALVALAALRQAGVELPPTVPESLITIALGALGTVLVLIRVITIPDTFAGIGDRSIGLWIALLSAIVVIVSGLLRAGEDL